MSNKTNEELLEYARSVRIISSIFLLTAVFSLIIGSLIGTPDSIFVGAVIGIVFYSYMSDLQGYGIEATIQAYQGRSGESLSHWLVMFYPPPEPNSDLEADESIDDVKEEQMEPQTED